MKKFKATVKVIYEFEFDSSSEKRDELDETANKLWYMHLDLGEDDKKYHDTEIEVDEI